MTNKRRPDKRVQTESCSFDGNIWSSGYRDCSGAGYPTQSTLQVERATGGHFVATYSL